MQELLFFQFFFQWNTEVSQLMEKTLTYIKNWRGSFKKNAKLSHIYHSCCREPSHTHPMETWSMREWPSKWRGTFIVIDEMGGWRPWAESVGLGEEVWWKVCQKFLSASSPERQLTRPWVSEDVSAVYVFSCRQQRLLFNHRTLVVYKQASDFQSLNNIY